MDALSLSALAVGGGTLAIASMPGRGGDYAGDLAVFREFRPGFVITMITSAEMARAGVPHLGSDIQSLGSRWGHMPVEDFGAPDVKSAARWPEISTTARNALKGGGRVLVHCFGGCGRSGMAVLRLMIEIGEEPEDALERLRSIRPCAIETDAQMKWALGRFA